MKTHRQIDIEIVKSASKGSGTGYFFSPDGSRQTVEVPFTMPGDLAKALLLRKRKGVYASLLQEIIRPSPERAAARCKHFGVCGGCRAQHFSYEHQLKIKEAFVHKCFEPLLSDKTHLYPILPCNPSWEYRNKMEFSFSSNAAKDSFLGLMMDSGKGRVLNLEECHLVTPWFMDGIKAARIWQHDSELDAFHPFRNTGSLRTLTLREGKRTGDRLAMLTVSGNPDYALKKRQIDSFVNAMRAAIEPAVSNGKLSLFLRIQQTAKGMPTNFYEMHLYGPDHIMEMLNIRYEADQEPTTLQFKISPSAFFQPNTFQAEQLYAHALRHASIPDGSVIYDLYCGTGTLGICAAKKGHQVLGIELSPESSLDGKANAALNGLENIEILCGSVPDVLKEISAMQSYPLPNVVMVDPPRAGLDPSSIKQILLLNPKKIVYISCNPATQAQNIPHFTAAGYELTVLHPIDQFPHTGHVENIAILEKPSHIHGQ